MAAAELRDMPTWPLLRQDAALAGRFILCPIGLRHGRLRTDKQGLHDKMAGAVLTRR